jgi:mono/diheme cytochrome c family protein
MIKRLLILASLAVIAGGMLVLISYELVKLDWVSFMEIQPSYKPMEDPLAVAEKSIPIEGAAYVPGMGAPVNPVPVDEISITRGAQLYDINCAICHGAGGMGDGVVGTFFTKKPADLTAERIQTLSDGSIFVTISNGVSGSMPALNENLTVRDRWDVVNFMRTLAASK